MDSEPVTGGTAADSPAKSRALVNDLFEPSPRIYWFDLLSSATLGWVSLAAAMAFDFFSLPWFALSAISALALYRAVVFTHELVHVRAARLPGFTSVWNLLCGVPLLVPAFMYDGVHQDHHFKKQYGTAADGEYLPFGRPPRSRIVFYLLSHLLLPPLAAFRFAVLGPLATLVPTWRRFVWQRASSLSIDPAFRRRVPEQVPRSWWLQEWACTLYSWALLTLWLLGVIPGTFFAQLYLVVVAALLMNALRTLAAHRYLNEGPSLSFSEQLGDSINIGGGGVLTPLLAPVGLRYHALHHLFPTMPYHELGEAHRRLMGALPAQAVYRSTLRLTIWSALAELWRSAGSDRALEKVATPH